jgi:hypothetical protein
LPIINKRKKTSNDLEPEDKIKNTKTETTTNPNSNTT